MQIKGQTEPSTAVDDVELLRRFISTRDDSAFAALLDRHGPMVFGICRRTLRNHADAEDAFQATFIVLALKAHSIRDPRLIGNWLFGVATRIAGIARRANTRRATREGQFMRNSQPSSTQHQSPVDTVATIETQLTLDEEINRLPGKYRQVVIACYLQGMTKPQAAAHLKWPEGTVATRLGHARSLLRKRMMGSSPDFTGEDLTAALAPVLVPPALISLTVNAANAAATGTAATTGAISASAATMAKGALKMMLVTKIKITAAIVIASGFAIAGGAAIVRSPQSDPIAATAPPPLTTQPAPKRGASASDDLVSRMLSMSNAFDIYCMKHDGHFPPDLAAVSPYLEKKDRPRAFFTLEDEKALKIPVDPSPQWLNEHTSWVYLGGSDFAIKSYAREQLLKDMNTIYLHTKLDARHGFVMVSHLRVGALQDLPGPIARKEIEESKRKLELLQVVPATKPATTQPSSAK